jgi:uncharacterized protein involved in outer membrane biogenesis
MQKKILIIVGAIVALVAVAIVVVAANLNRIIDSRKDALLAQAEQRIGRDISVGDVGVALWPEIGARVRDVTISDDPAYSSEAFVRAHDVRVNVRLWPLLKKRVEVKRFVLDAPEVTIIKGAGKRFNFTSLVEAVAGPGATRSSSGAEAVPFVLAFADIQGGTVHYVDKAAGIDRTVKKIDFSAKDVSLESAMTATLAAAVIGDDQDVHVVASVGPVGSIASPENLSRAPLSATLSFGPVTLSKLVAAAPSHGAPNPALPEDADVSADATISGTLGAAMLDRLNVRVVLFDSKDPNIEMHVSAGPFNALAESTLVFAGAHVKGDLTAGPIKLADLKLPPADPAKPAPKLDGELRGKATFDGDLTSVAFTAHLDATQAGAVLAPQFDKRAGVPATLDVAGTFRPEGTPDAGADLSSIDIVFHALRATGKGRFVPFKGHEAMDIALNATSAIAPWKDVLPALAPFEPAGEMAASVHIIGAPKPGAVPDVRGTATFSGVRATLPQVPNPMTSGAGSATFTAKTAHVDKATFTIGKSAFRASADITSFAPMAATYAVTSPEIWRTDVQAVAPNAPKLPRPDVFRDVTVTGTATEKAPTVFENAMKITSKSGVASNIDYTNATATIHATPETVIIDSFDAGALAGTISGSGTFVPKSATFDVTTHVKDINLAEYFRYKSPALVDVLRGRMSGDLSLTGAGNSWQDIQKTLSGKGSTIVIEGALLNVNVAKQVISSIQSMPLVPADLTQKLRDRNPKLFDSNTTVFQNMKSEWSIADGKIQVPDLKLATNDFALAGKGWFGLDKDMSVNTTLTLSDKLTGDLVAEVPAAKYLLGASGKLEIPLSLTGALTSPNVGVDATALQSKLQSSLMQQGQEGLKQQVKGLLDNLKKKEEPKKKP